MVKGLVGALRTPEEAATDEVWTVIQLWRMPDGGYVSFESTRMTYTIAETLFKCREFQEFKDSEANSPTMVGCSIGQASEERMSQPSYNELRATRPAGQMHSMHNPATKG